MFDFERIFVCRGLRSAEGGYTAEGIEFVHPASTPFILLFGHILGARLNRDVHVYVEIESSPGLEVGPVLAQTYSLHPGKQADRRLFLARVPVRGLLDPGHYQAIISVERWTESRTGFQII